MKRPAYEKVIVTVVVTLSIVLGFALYAGRAKVRKSEMLTNELSMFRSAVMLYKMTNKKNPESLEELGTATYDMDSVKRVYLDRIPRGADGRIADPFGSAYAYDPKSGWVNSTTQGFEKW